MTKFIEFLADTLETTWGKTEMFGSLIAGAIAIGIGWWVHWTMGLSLTVFCLLWGHASYRAYSRLAGQLDALKNRKTAREEWASLVAAFEKISPQVHADWKQGKWSLTSDSAPEKQRCENLLKRAGKMRDSKSTAPFSGWLDFLRTKHDYFHLEMFDGRPDPACGRIAHVAEKSARCCEELETNCISN